MEFPYTVSASGPMVRAGFGIETRFREDYFDWVVKVRCAGSVHLFYHEPGDTAEVLRKNIVGSVRAIAEAVARSANDLVEVA